MQQSLLNIKVSYCAPCGYQPRVLDLTREIIGERELEHYVGSWTLIPASHGVFEVEINGELVFSKKALGRHAEPGEIRAILLAKVEALRPPQQ